MKVLLDHNISEHLKPLLASHTVFAAYDRRWDGWDQLRNGHLLRAAEADLFDVMVTGDKKMFYQQNNRTRLISLVVLSTNKWKILEQQAEIISHAISRAQPGSYEYVTLDTVHSSPRMNG